MNMTLSDMNPAENKYTYSQSQQISMQTGLIGYLRADMDSNGKGFYSTWNDFRDQLKTDEFKAEFDDVINACRFDKEFGGVLSDRSSLNRFCYEHKNARFENSSLDEYGIRINTTNYAYLMRLNPQQGCYNLYCYCYVRKWLDSHLESAKKGIRFITPDYKKRFMLEDGDKIRITRTDGENKDYTCRYIDEYHLEVGNNLYHICEFAERMQDNGNKVIPYRSGLPERCYAIMPGTKELILIQKGEQGYFPCEYSTPNAEMNRAIATERNDKLGVTKAQEEAILAGSMFGWEVPAADPRSYNENGVLIADKHKDRGDAR